MTNSTIQTIANTPWWVYVLFVFLIRVGFSAMKSRIVPFRTLFILPSIFLVLSVMSLYSYLFFNPKHIAIWMGAILLGSLLGWLQFKVQNIKAVKNTAKIMLPGTSSILIMMICLFIARYYFSFQLSVDPNLFTQENYLVKALFIYGLFTGLFLGRAMYAIRCLRSGPYITEPVLS